MKLTKANGCKSQSVWQIYVKAYTGSEFSLLTFKHISYSRGKAQLE
jgi:hypothetical protein